MHVLNTKQKKSQHISKKKKYKNAMLDDYTKKSANKPKNYKSKCTNRGKQSDKKNKKDTNIENTNFTNKPRHKLQF